MERAYKIIEIDEMRSAVETLELRNSYGMVWYSGSYDDEKQRQKVLVEEKLRTYLVAGCDPHELKMAAAEHKLKLTEEMQVQKKDCEEKEKLWIESGRIGNFYHPYLGTSHKPGKQPDYVKVERKKGWFS